MTSRVGAGGELVIPERFLELAGLSAGDPVAIDVDNAGRIVISTISVEPERPLRGRFQGSGMTNGLLTDRGHEPR